MNERIMNSWYRAIEGELSSTLCGLSLRGREVGCKGYELYLLIRGMFRPASFLRYISPFRCSATGFEYFYIPVPEDGIELSPIRERLHLVAVAVVVG